MLKSSPKGSHTPAVEKSEEDDATLMQRIASGDEAAFRALLERHARRALRFMQRLVLQKQDAEDEVQKAFLKVWQEASRWRPEAKFTTWFYRVLMNQAVDVMRARKRTHVPLNDELVDASPNAEDMSAAGERARTVQKALASLPDRQRQALILCHYEELSQKEAAAILGVTEGALESLLSRGRAALRQQIAKEWYN